MLQPKPARRKPPLTLQHPRVVARQRPLQALQHRQMVALPEPPTPVRSMAAQCLRQHSCCWLCRKGSPGWTHPAEVDGTVANASRLKQAAEFAVRTLKVGLDQSQCGDVSACMCSPARCLLEAQGTG